MKKYILVVDDTPANLTMAVAALKEAYRLKVANNGKKALELARLVNDPPDLILLDVSMPEIDGYEVCRQLKADPQTMRIPIVFLTAHQAADEEIFGLSLGAADYIHKPFIPQIMKKRVENQLLVKEASDFMLDQNLRLEHLVADRTQELLSTQDVLIMALSSLAETRDNDTGNHLRRTQTYVQILVDKLAQGIEHGSYFEQLPPQLLFKLAPLHDIGKVGIPDSILLKPGKLTDEEFAIMKKHPVMGGEAILRAQEQLGIHFQFLDIAREIVVGHHEKWDGSGYPNQLKEEAIPMPARLMALADVYDALICRRVYKEPIAPQQVEAMIVKGRGTHFDPKVVDAFIATRDQFYEIAQAYRDE